MARYADIDKVMQNLNTNKYGDTNVVEVGIALDKAIADVVPKSEVERLQHILDSYALQYGTVMDKHIVIEKAREEVAREIFEEIENLITNECLTARDSRDIEGYVKSSVHYGIAKLKKKYTESEDKR